MKRQRYTGQMYTSAAASSAWIAPDGRWYHVNDCSHRAAAAAMGSSVGSLEDAGYVHLSWNYPYFVGSRPTDAQIVRLEEAAERWEEEAQKRHAGGGDMFDVTEAEEYASSLIERCREWRKMELVTTTRYTRNTSADAFFAALKAAEAITYRRDGD